jgi:hypothetical protein
MTCVGLDLFFLSRFSMECMCVSGSSGDIHPIPATVIPSLLNITSVMEDVTSIDTPCFISLLRLLVTHILRRELKTMRI